MPKWPFFDKMSKLNQNDLKSTKNALKTRFYSLIPLKSAIFEKISILTQNDLKRA